MNVATLSDLDAAGIAAAFNRVYQGYAVPVSVDAAWAERHTGDLQIDLAASPLWLDGDGRAAGLAALGVRGDRGWIGGFGLAPEQRGRGLGRELLAEIVASARRLGLRRLQLEVLAENAPAIALYARGGFRQTRVLRILEGDGPPDGAGGPTAREIAPDQVLRDFGRLHPDPMPWQREADSFASLEDLRAVAVGDPDAPRAALLYQPGKDGGVRVLDVATAGEGDAAADAVASLLASAASRQPGQTLRLLNEPAGSPVDHALSRLGWRESGRQFEMELEL